MSHESHRSCDCPGSRADVPGAGDGAGQRAGAAGWSRRGRHRIPVEEAKPAGERGLYLHPVELGQPAELGLDYQRNLDETE
ncbi:MAG: hypothetical protein WBE17_16820 [Anaerolineae bacterium]|uniref:hypothetical protein n=1 Tax=Candidatus Amarolinea dominans TaxID=3140696 RepID=UPI003136F078|nr:hypothetical protein [Anaerolineae bacterium]